MPYDENGDWIPEDAPAQEPSPWERYGQTQPTLPYSGAEQSSPVAEITPPPLPEAPPEQLTQQPTRYQPFPGLPVVVEGNQASYNGRPVADLNAAFAARAQDAANPQSQQAFQQAEAARVAPPQTGDATTPEMTSIQLRQEMDRTQLSRADQLELTQLQNGIARVQRDTREGRVPQTQAQQLIQQMEGRANPLTIRARTFHALQQLQTYQLQQEHFRQLSAANVANEHYRSGSNLNPILSTDGRFYQNHEGRWEPVPPDRADAGNAAREERAARAKETAQALSLHHYSQALTHNIDALTRQSADITQPEAIRNRTPEQIHSAAVAATDRAHRAAMAAVGINPDGSPLAPAASSRSAAPAGPTAPPTASAPTANAPVPTAPLPEPSVREQAQPTSIPVDRMRVVQGIVNSIVPSRRGDANFQSPLDLRSSVQVDLGRTMQGILANASRENRPLTNREATDYENSRRQLAQDNPDAARLASLTPVPEQDAFGHSEERAGKLKELVPLLRDEAGRLFNSTSMTERMFASEPGRQVPFLRHLGNEAAPLVSGMYEILNNASKENRRLNPAETAKYLHSWRQLRRVNSGWADRLALHQ